MNHRLVAWCVLLPSSLVAAAIAAAQPLHHDLRVILDPTAQRIEVVDAISLGDMAADGEGGYPFLLHAGLNPEPVSEGWHMETLAAPADADFAGINASSDSTSARVPVESFRLQPPAGGGSEITLRYGGIIHHPLQTQGEEYQRSFSETPGLISSDGVFLAGASFWVPSFGDQLTSFRLEVSGLEPPWSVVSQGRRTVHDLAADGARRTVWVFDHPAEEIYLVAGPWHEYAVDLGEVEAFAFLRSDDPGLAERYLAASERYLAMYQKMLTPFPFASFALVENFWETGYGMPGFTLLGPQVIRFPWILSSSYPHELLHNWWGNSVYVDFAGGNWCEGLTAYLADHLLAEQRGEGAAHRRATLQKFSDFVDEHDDFPLTEFSSRRSAASEAVGYGKSLMLFHMLRRAVGNEAFLAALRHFDHEHRFTRASFAELAASFTEISGADWEPFFADWTGQAGAPLLAIRSLTITPSDSSDNPWLLALELEQRGVDRPFPINVPVAVVLEGRDDALWTELGTCRTRCQLTIPCPTRPLGVHVDPAFDLMRRLDPREVPPAISTLLGAAQPSFILPAAAGADERAAWRELAAAWAKPAAAHIIGDDEIDELPGGSAWVLGWSNRFADAVADRLAPHGVEFGDDQLRVAGDRLPRADHSLVVVARSPDNPAAALGWVAADPVSAIPGLARKLPHYSKYSYLVFSGSEPTNVAKGVWPVVDSPLSRSLGDAPLPPLELPERAPLAELPPPFSAAALLATASALADPSLDGRGLGSPGLARATELVEGRLRAMGLEPAGDDGFRQRWSWTGGDPPRPMELVNLVGRIPGNDPALADSPVLVMAHLDHLGRGWPEVRTAHRGELHPGADDNASGVAVLLELAASFAAEPPRPRPLLFAVVTGEEADLLGSRHLLDSLAAGAPTACLNLDTVGRLGDGKLLVLNADSAREWRFIFMGVGYTTGAPIAIVAENLDASDQTACLERGIPAVQLFSGPHDDYHRPGDTADKLDGEGMVVVTAAAKEALDYLAERTQTLTAAEREHAAAGGHPGSARTVSLGTTPDFSHGGPGVRVEAVREGSPAATAGVRAGDLLLALAGRELDGIRAYSEALKAHQVGDEVELRIQREGDILVLDAVLGER